MLLLATLLEEIPSEEAPVEAIAEEGTDKKQRYAAWRNEFRGGRGEVIVLFNLDKWSIYAWLISAAWEGTRGREQGSHRRRAATPAPRNTPYSPALRCPENWRMGVKMDRTRPAISSRNLLFL